MHVSNCLAAPRTCSKPAVGFETRVAIMIAEEGFTTTGLMVTERNWLDVYPYASWGGNANLPVFQQGQQFIPQDILLRQVCDLWPPF
jgi:DNA topoisomerase-3